ncbi:transcriptional regulator [Plantactinospora sp. S1510]|uniref:Transcriptional regulator n=1 Tax=Plantactinospora alkalitolerans TaxID=2789879 RepID=A0ABS0GRZ4_9ACTN|nr:transcriptional regulator [Plantactinospora alkalitolerans]MBF9128957.1 transcriptional regulator [Plantactinospora alkalitolerans]
MASPDSPETIASTRSVRAAAVFEGRVDLTTYPHRYLAIVAQPRFRFDPATYAMAAAEALEAAGWELVTMSNFNTSNVYAVMRRRR